MTKEEKLRELSPVVGRDRILTIVVVLGRIVLLLVVFALVVVLVAILIWIEVGGRLVALIVPAGPVAV